MNKKVAFYIPLLNIGGAERVVVDLLREFADREEFEVYIITDIERSVLIDQIPKTVRCVHLKCAGGFSKMHKIFRLRTLLQEHGFDFVISNLTHANVHVALAKVLFRLKGIKLILIEHSVPSQYIGQIRGVIKRELLKTFVLLFYRSADKIVCVSRTVRDDLVKHFYVSNLQCEVIYNPVDICKILALKAEALDLDVIQFIKNKKVLISVGRLSKEKNHKLLLRAFVLLRSYDEFVLLLVGDGALRKELEDFVTENNLIDCIKFLGFQTNPYKYMEASDILVLPSMFEGFGLVLFEAMMLGKQVVAVRSEATTEIVNLMGNGFLSNNEPQDLAEKVLLASSRHIVDKEMIISKCSRFSVSNVYLHYKNLLCGL